MGGECARVEHGRVGRVSIYSSIGHQAQGIMDGGGVGRDKEIDRRTVH